jgi:hypothetical protein
VWGRRTQLFFHAMGPGAPAQPSILFPIGLRPATIERPARPSSANTKLFVDCRTRNDALLCELPVIYRGSKQGAMIPRSDTSYLAQVVCCQRLAERAVFSALRSALAQASTRNYIWAPVFNLQRANPPRSGPLPAPFPTAFDALTSRICPAQALRPTRRGKKFAAKEP